MQLKNYINGSWTSQVHGDVIQTENPFHGNVVSVLPAGSSEDAASAVHAAMRAQPAWSALAVEERVSKLLEYADAIEDRSSELVRIEAEEMGKPVSIGGSFLANGVKTFRETVQDALEYSFSNIVKIEDGVQTSVIRKPLGVVAVIVPWNFTATTVLQGIGAFLAAGNAVVVKPSEKSSGAAVKMFEMLDGLDFPPGVLNLLLGDGRSGGPLVENPGVTFVHFTGSVATGREISQRAGSKLHRSVMELGGKDAVVIDRDVDVSYVAGEVAAGSFLNSGQICTSMERIYVHEDIREQFLDSLIREAAKFSLGDPLDASTVLGPMVDRDQLAIVEGHLSEARQLGASVVFQGSAPGGSGNEFPATVVTGVHEEMKLMKEETFGPIAAVQFIESFEKGLEFANQTEFGLAATVYSNSESNLLAAKKSLEVGILWLNKWQGGDLGRPIEPARLSGTGAMGGSLSYDSATRPQAVHTPV